MSIRPIDLQTNINQLPEVARNQNIKNESIVQQQYIADQEAALKSNLVNTRLGENKKTDETLIKDEEKNRRNPNQKNAKNDEEETEKEELSSNVKYVRDLGLGRIIDIKK